jgi:hypothetical protein
VSHGPAYRTGLSAASSQKTLGCGGDEWAHCGSNTLPAGFFLACHSASGVFDLNGNAAEHMNLPRDESQISSRGSRELGVTEMKGSWFIFDRYRAHEDWCRWRAPFWDGSRVMDANSQGELSPRLPLLQDDPLTRSRAPPAEPPDERACRATIAAPAGWHGGCSSQSGRPPPLRGGTGTA